MTDAERERDVETVRAAMRAAGFSPAGGALPAFERLVTELDALLKKVASLDEEILELRMGDDL